MVNTLFKKILSLINIKMSAKKFNYVDYYWDDSKAAELEGNEIDLFLYRSNMLGADLRITNYGGGNTSCKTIEKDPLTGKEVEVLWVKGSGGDIGTLTRSGIAGLYVQKMHELKKVYRGIEHEDEIVGLLNHCIFDLESKAPSIDTPLHGLLPFKHIDHLHPDSLIAIAAAENSKEITKEIWNGEIGWVDWQRPGFDLAIQLENHLKENPGIKGIVLAKHGVFTWGDTSYECYINSLEVLEDASRYIAEKEAGKTIFGGQKRESLPAEKRKAVATKMAPVLRGLVSSNKKMIGHFTDDERVLQFINSNQLDALAPLGTSCPDHFLRTKIQPLVLNLDAEREYTPKEIKEIIEPQFEKYRKEYADYYNACKHGNSPAMRDANPVIILYPGVGMFSFAKNKQTARVAAEFYINAINVMRGAEAISKYTSLPRQEAFDIEYWLLEEAKLQRMPKEKPLSRRVALVTGAGGGIGKAIAEKLIEEGANVVYTDLSEERLVDSTKSLSTDIASFISGNVADEVSVQAKFDKAALDFGGVDIVVHSAGLAISKPLEETELSDWNILQDVLVKGQFLIAKKAAEVMRIQGFGGDIVNIASKNGLVAGPNNIGYGTAKAAQQHMTRLLAVELAPSKIKVNTVNPDGVITGSKIWEGEWAEGRAKAYGISVEELPAFYAKRNLLQEIILPEDIANGVFATIAVLTKSTGQTLNVDGGVANAFVR